MGACARECVSAGMHKERRWANEDGTGGGGRLERTDHTQRPHMTSHTQKHTHTHTHMRTHTMNKQQKTRRRTHSNRSMHVFEPNPHQPARGDNPALTLSTAARSLPARTSASTTGNWPWAAARWSEVRPFCNNIATRHDPRTLPTAHFEVQTGPHQHTMGEIL